MVDIFELQEAIIALKKKEMSCSEIINKLKEKGIDINSRFWEGLRRLERYETIIIDDGRKPWIIKVVKYGKKKD